MLFSQNHQPRRDPKERLAVPFREVQEADAFLGASLIHWDHVPRLEAFIEAVGGATLNLPGTHSFGYNAVHLADVHFIVPRWAASALEELVQRCGSKLIPSTEPQTEWKASQFDISVFRMNRTSS